MKKHLYKPAVILSLALLCLMPLTAKDKEEVPSWLTQDYKTVFSYDTYIAELATGKTQTDSKTNAAAALARFMSTTIVSNSSASSHVANKNGKTTADESSLFTETQVSTDIQNLFGLEYTEPYYDKKHKTWYCVAYIEKAKAWQQYKPVVDMAVTAFEGFYKKAENQREYLYKIELYEKAIPKGNELLRCLEYGRLFAPEQEDAYEAKRNTVMLIPSLIEEAKNECTVYVDVTNDFNGSINAAVSNSLSNCGFNVARSKNRANYTAIVVAEDYQNGSDPLSIKPVIDIKIDFKEGDTVYSFAVEAKDKTVAYSLDTARKRAYPELSTQVEQALTEDLTSLFKLK